MKQLIVYLIYFLCGGISLFGQDSLKTKFRSRALLDATVSGYGKEQAQGYYSLEDFRVGFKAVYGKYELKADIGLGGGKVAIKDLMLNYHLKNSVLALGNGYEPFSMDMLINTVDLRFHQSATSVLAFADSRKFGITYHYYNKHCYLATGVYTNNDINKLGGESHKNSFVSTSRGVVRKIKDKGRLLHVGGAVSYRTSQVNVEESPIGSVSSDGVTSMFPAALLEVDIPDMGSELKGVIEFLYTAPRFMIQSEYFFDCLHLYMETVCNTTGGRKTDTGYLLHIRSHIKCYFSYLKALASGKLQKDGYNSLYVSAFYDGDNTSSSSSFLLVYQYGI
jgi:phosphate-selective porin OprO and OprP